MQAGASGCMSPRFTTGGVQGSCACVKQQPTAWACITINSDGVGAEEGLWRFRECPLRNVSFGMNSAFSAYTFPIPER